MVISLHITSVEQIKIKMEIMVGAESRPFSIFSNFCSIPFWCVVCCVGVMCDVCVLYFYTVLNISIDDFIIIIDDIIGIINKIDDHFRFKC